ncbi:MAG TPA: NAD-binding protein, partial [Spirochaetia bacterium]|nr:NAD-binding protein [Spirochaetia bacterium]
MRNNVQKRNGYSVIVGCGELGARLAGAFSESGQSVVIIDRDSERFSLLPPGFSGFTLEGDAVELLTLQRAKTGQASIFVATTESDSVNLFTCQTARTYYEVPTVACRIYDPELEEICRTKGIIPIPSIAVEAESFMALLG